MLLDRMFVHTKIFDRLWSELGCDDDDLTELQKAISDDPQRPPVIPGTGGIRKIRISLDGKGKSGGARVLYVDFVIQGIVGLLSAYPKSVKENITDEEKKILKSMADTIKQKLEG